MRRKRVLDLCHYDYYTPSYPLTTKAFDNLPATTLLDDLSGQTTGIFTRDQPPFPTMGKKRPRSSGQDAPEDMDSLLDLMAQAQHLGPQKDPKPDSNKKVRGGGSGGGNVLCNATFWVLCSFCLP